MDFYSEIDILDSELQFDGVKVKPGQVTYVRHDYELNELLNPVNGQLAVTQSDYALNYYDENTTSWKKVVLSKTYDKLNNIIPLTDDYTLLAEDSGNIFTNQGATKDIVVTVSYDMLNTPNYNFKFVSVSPYKIKIRFFSSFRIDDFYNTIETSDDAGSFETIEFISCNQLGRWNILFESTNTGYNKYIEDLNLAPGNTGVYTSINRTTATVINHLEYINISSLSDGSEFGDLGIALGCSDGASNANLGTGVFSGSYDPDGGYSKVNQYIRFVSGCTGDTFCYSAYEMYSRTVCDTGTRNRCVFAGGWSAQQDWMEYIRTNLPGGNAFAFGRLTRGRGMATAASNDVYERGSCHTDWTNVDGMEYWNMKVAGTCIQFGTLANPWSDAGATSNGILNRVIRAGGYAGKKHINYFNLLSLSDAELFGNLIYDKRYNDMTSNKINNRGLIIGGDQTYKNTIEYINISSLGDASIFGNVIREQTSINWSGACSNA